MIWPPIGIKEGMGDPTGAGPLWVRLTTGGVVFLIVAAGITYTILTGRNPGLEWVIMAAFSWILACLLCVLAFRFHATRDRQV